MYRVSIVIPTLNEASCIERSLRHLKILDLPAWEVIIVDGGSDDGTVELAREYSQNLPNSTTVKIISASKRGRAVQMNQGAEVASGELLCFLHADTWVPDDLVTVISRTLQDPAIACGGFISLMSGSGTTRWGISLHNYLKTYYAPLLFRPHLFFRGLRLLFGDQVMFCRRQDFQACGGFDPDLPIVEEADLCLKLVQYGKIRLVNRVVQSSDRRVERWGSFKATMLYLYVGFGWAFGLSPHILKRAYEDIR